MLCSQKLGAVVCTCNPGANRQRPVDPGALLVCQSSCNGKSRLRERSPVLKNGGEGLRGWGSVHKALGV